MRLFDHEKIFTCTLYANSENALCILLCTGNLRIWLTDVLFQSSFYSMVFESLDATVVTFDNSTKFVSFCKQRFQQCLCVNMSSEYYFFLSIYNWSLSVDTFYLFYDSHRKTK